MYDYEFITQTIKIPRTNKKSASNRSETLKTPTQSSLLSTENPTGDSKKRKLEMSADKLTDRINFDFGPTTQKFHNPMEEIRRLTAQVEELTKQLAQSQQSIADLTKLVAQQQTRSRSTEPTTTDNILPSTLTETETTNVAQTQTTTYAAAVKKDADKRPKKKTQAQKQRTFAQAVRAFQPPAGPSTYDLVYLPCRRHLRYGEVRKQLSALKIQQSRILDIQFPARGTIGLLVHYDFKEELVKKLGEVGILTKKFDPLDSSTIADPNYANKSAAERASIARDLHEKRMIVACQRMPRQVAISVANFFGNTSSPLRLSDKAFKQCRSFLTDKGKTQPDTAATLFTEEMEADDPIPTDDTQDTNDDLWICSK